MKVFTHITGYSIMPLFRYGAWLNPQTMILYTAWYRANHFGIGPTKLLVILYNDLGYKNAVDLPAFFSLLESNF